MPGLVQGIDCTMITLGLDTATSACACAIWSACEGRALAVRAEEMQRGQAERLVPLVQDTLRNAGLRFADINRIAVTVGPGTFTGLRIGLAAARGFALAAGCPLIGVTSLEVAVAGLSHEFAGCQTLAAIESRREELFLQPFSAAGLPLADPVDLSPAALRPLAATWFVPGPLVIVGDAAERAAVALGDGRHDLRVIVTHGGDEALAGARIAAKLDTAAIACRPAEPLYIRQPDVSLPGR
jgi:tRNA threonylcarbamoyladenosine biosynthesis protein TsaB